MPVDSASCNTYNVGHDLHLITITNSIENMHFDMHHDLLQLAKEGPGQV